MVHNLASRLDLSSQCLLSIILPQHAYAILSLLIVMLLSILSFKRNCFKIERSQVSSIHELGDLLHPFSFFFKNKTLYISGGGGLVEGSEP